MVERVYPNLMFARAQQTRYVGKRKNAMPNWVALLLAFGVGCFFGVFASSIGFRADFEREAIQHRAAHFDLESGAFTWGAWETTE